MNIISKVKGWFNQMFKSEVKRVFGVTAITSGRMEEKIAYWLSIYRGEPEWVDVENNIKTINFAKTVCEETARLAVLDIGVTFDGRRADYMKKWNDEAVMPKLRQWIEYGCAAGTIILKPNGAGVDMFMPGSFEITEKDGIGNITGVTFQDRYKQGDYWYTKLEQHSFFTANVRYKEDEERKSVTFYKVQNKAFVSDSEAEIGTPCDLVNTKWANLKPEVHITKNNDEKINNMLFGIFKMPNANNIDFDSPLGMSIFSEAIEELKDLDIAYSRNAQEIFDSESIELLGAGVLQEPGKKINSSADIKLPHHIKKIPGTSQDDFYHAIERPLNTDKRIVGINHLLSDIGYKCGYSNGYFVLDQKTGMITATQVEADDRRTIQLIKDVRENIQKCLKDLYYAQSVFADLYNYAPVGDYKPIYSFGDITYNYEEDKARWWNYVQSGKIPFWYYLTKFEKMSEEEAKQIEAAAVEEKKKSGLFEDE